jgi:tetraprenyl-beta-curcumene synthase
MASPISTAGTFARATRRYWLSVFPHFRCELGHWHALANGIKNPALRHLALSSQHAKRRSLEGAVAFATFVPRSAQRAVVTALTTYQIIFDYLDTVAEQPNTDPIRNGRNLNRALIDAVEPAPPPFDYYAHHETTDDDGYLETLIATCSAALKGLPSYPTILPLLRCAAGQSASYQSLNHGDANGSHAEFTAWARQKTQPNTGLRWWEAGAAAGSSLAELAFIGAMADPGLTLQDAEALGAAYDPWIGALHTLLDSLVDHHEDTATPGQRSLIDYYGSPIETAARLELIAMEAVNRAKRLPHASHHTLILAAMTSFYLSDSHASTSSVRLAKRLVLDSMGHLATPTMLVMHGRHVANRALCRPTPTQNRLGFVVSQAE